MRPGGYAMALAAMCLLAGCDSGADQPGSAAGPVADALPPAAAQDAYLKRFSAGDPEACFGEARLDTATFEGRQAAPPAPPPTRVLVAIDASGSMAGKVSGRTKLELARTAAQTFIEGLPAEAEAGLLVFGQAGDNSPRGKAPSCGAVELAVPLSRDRDALVRGVSGVRAIGWTPLAAALRQAETLLAKGGAPGAQVIYVVSDGQETCGGDPVAVARAINTGHTRAVVNIIGFAVPDGEAAALAAVASAGGGRFVNVAAGDRVDAVAARIRESGRQASNRLAESGTTARNTLSTSGTAAKARLCIGGLVARERIAVGADIARKRMAGDDVAVEEAAEQRLAARHAALEQRVETFTRRLDARMQAANRDIAEDAARAE